MPRRGRSAFLALLPVVGGCFSYTTAVQDRPVPAHVVELTLNDRGRIAMEDHIGADVLTVEGSVASSTDSAFVLKVERVATLNGQMTTWAGESVTFRPEYVRAMRERRFSVGRTALLVGSATAAALALVASPLTNSIFGGSNGPAPGSDPGQVAH